MNKAEALHEIRKISGALNDAKKALEILAEKLIGEKEIETPKGENYTGTITRETPKALLVKLSNYPHREFWLPKKVVEWTDKGEYFEFIIPEWLMSEKLEERAQ